MNKGQLFTQYFLEDGICQTEAWGKCGVQAVDNFRSDIAPSFENFSMTASLNESQTEHEFILPILRILGWKDYST